jgi:hypothetical protein
VTQKILSCPLSLSLPAITFHTSGRPWCRTFARPLLLNHPANCLLNPPLSSPHRRPSPRRLPLTDLACLNASRHCNTLQQLPASSVEATLHLLLCPPTTGALLPRVSPLIWWVGTLVCTAEVQRHRQTPRQLSAPLVKAAIASVSPHHHGTSTRQSTVRLFVWICCDLICLTVFCVLMLICCMGVSSFVTSRVSIRFNVDVSVFLLYLVTWGIVSDWLCFNTFLFPTDWIWSVPYLCGLLIHRLYWFCCLHCCWRSVSSSAHLCPCLHLVCLCCLGVSRWNLVIWNTATDLITIETFDKIR